MWSTRRLNDMDGLSLACYAPPPTWGIPAQPVTHHFVGPNFGPSQPSQSRGLPEASAVGSAEPVFHGARSLFLFQISRWSKEAGASNALCNSA